MPIPPKAGLGDYARILLKRKGWVIVSVVIAASIAGYFQKKMVPLYVATAKITAEPPFVEMEPFIGRQPAVKEDSWGLQPSSFLQAQYELLRSRIVAERAAEILGWVRDKEPAVERIQKAIEIAPIQESKRAAALSSVIAIKATDRNPRAAMDMANAVSEAFVDIKKRERDSIVKNIYSNLVEQVRKAREKVDESEDALEKFKQESGVQTGIPQELNMETEGDIKNELLRIEKEKSEKESTLKSLREIAESDLIQALTFVSEKLGSVYTVNVGLKQKLLDKENELNALSQVYKEKHPEIIRVKSEIDLVRGQIRDELEAAANSLTSDIQTLSNLEEVVGAYQKRPEAGVDQSRLLRLQKEVNLNRDIYENILRKLKEVSLEEEVRGTVNVKIIEPASLPVETAQPVRLPVSGASAIGFLVGIMLALMREAMDTTVRTIEDVERYLGLSVLGAVPHIRRGRRPVKKTAVLHKGKNEPGK